jgi:hypothetical protein
MKTSLAVILFNRPDHAKVLRACLDVEQDRDLFVIVDGARTGREGEVELVKESIDAFLDWKGRVQFNISDRNLGCKARVSSGLTWVFEHTDRAIILEDDLLPSPQFFQFCDEMLEAYADNSEVMSVCGTKTYPAQIENSQYFFSKYNNCWGWATWKRAWVLYDDRFDQYSSVEILKRIKLFLGTFRAALYWLFRLKQVQSGKKSSWAYCWSVAGFLNQGLHIVPSQNLIINQGFGECSTHTSHVEYYVPREYGSELGFPIQKLEEIRSCESADRWTEDNVFSKSLKNRFRWLLSKGTLKKILSGNRI